MARNITSTELIEQQPFLIYTPKREIFQNIAKHWLMLFLAVVLSFNVFWLISIPLYVLTVYQVLDFSVRWKSHRYSILVLHMGNGLVFLVFAIIASPLRNSVGTILGKL